MVVWRCSGGKRACICIRILTSSIGFVATTWKKPAPNNDRAPMPSAPLNKASDHRGASVRLTGAGEHLPVEGE
jgi:hypothetical protein